MKISSTVFGLVASSLLVAGCTPRSDVVDEKDVATATPDEKAATCIKKNLFPKRNAFIRVADDGLTVSFSRKKPGYDDDSYSDKVEVSLFNNRGIGDDEAGAFTVLALGDDNDKAMVAVMESCVVENMPGVMNFELQPSLPAPEGYQSLSGIKSRPPATPAP